MNLLRIVASMAWSNGNLSEEEVDLMLDRFGGLFAADAPQQAVLRQELRDYLMQNIPLEELVPQLQTTAERELVLKLGYEVIQSSARTPDEDLINAEEKVAYQKLIQLLNFAPETVARIEQDSMNEMTIGEGLVDSLTRKLSRFIQG